MSFLYFFIILRFFLMFFFFNLISVLLSYATLYYKNIFLETLKSIRIPCLREFFVDPSFPITPLLSRLEPSTSFSTQRADMSSTSRHFCFQPTYPLSRLVTSDRSHRSSEAVYQQPLQQHIPSF